MSLRRGLAHVEWFAVCVAASLFLAAIVELRSNVRGEGREAALRDGLESLRTAVEMYRYQHEGRWPAAADTDPEALATALVERTDVEGHPTTDGAFGPYVVGRLPTNPYNGLRSVRIVDGATFEPDDGTGWLYDPRTGSIVANSTGTDDGGRPLSSL